MEQSSNLSPLAMAYRILGGLPAWVGHKEAKLV